MINTPEHEWARALCGFPVSVTRLLSHGVPNLNVGSMCSPSPCPSWPGCRAPSSAAQHGCHAPSLTPPSTGEPHTESYVDSSLSQHIVRHIECGRYACKHLQ